MVWLSFKSPDDTNGFTKELRKLQSRENDLPTDELKLEYIKLTKKSVRSTTGIITIDNNLISVSGIWCK